MGQQVGGGTGPLTTLVTGVVIGALAALLAVSFGGLIFTGPLSAAAGPGIGVALFGGLVLLVVIGLRSSLPGVIATAQDATAAVLVVVVAGIASTLGTDHPGFVATSLATVALTTGLTGLSLWLLGTFRLGRLVRYVPYPVIGGFLAGTGWLLLDGGLGLLAGDRTFRLVDPGTWTDTELLWHLAPGCVVAVVLLVAVRRGKGAVAIPVVCVATVVVFYAVVLLGPGTERAVAAGWLLGPFPGGSLWPPPVEVVRGVVPSAILQQLPGILTVVLLSAVALLLNATGIERDADDDVDLDQELRAAGAANALAAIGGGIPGFHALSVTSLAQRGQVLGRPTLAVAAVVVGLALIFSGDLVGWLPRPLVGGLLAFLGLAFLWEWVVDGFHRLRRVDHAIVLLILLVIATVGFLEGVSVGVAATAVVFLVAYSRTDVVRHALTGRTYPSQVDRSSVQLQALATEQDSIRILVLQGYLFFGTAARLLDRLKAELAEHDDTRFLVLDLRQVSGLDSSALESIQRARQLAARSGATLVLTSVSADLRERIGPAAGPPEPGQGAEVAGGAPVFPDLDTAVGWCEDRILAGQAASGQPVSLAAWLAAGLGDDELAHRLLAALVLEQVEEGTVILRQGERSRDLYFLGEGVVTIWLSDATGHRRRLRTMHAGTVLGEVALYLDAPRAAVAVADTACSLARLTPAALATLERDDPAVAVALHRLLATNLAARLSSTLATIEALGS